jgi:hypothetical protein
LTPASIRLIRTPRAAIPRPTVSAVWDTHHKQQEVYAATTASANGTRTAALLTGPIRKPASEAASQGDNGVVEDGVQPNALYLEAVLGHDEPSLRGVLSPFAPGFSFLLRWVADEDVLLRPAFSVTTTVRREEIVSTLRALKTRLVRVSLPWCARVEEALVGEQWNVIWRETWRTIAASGSKHDSDLPGPPPSGPPNQQASTALGSAGQVGLWSFFGSEN